MGILLNVFLYVSHKVHMNKNMGKKKTTQMSKVSCLKQQYFCYRSLKYNFQEEPAILLHADFELRILDFELYLSDYQE